MVSICFHCMAEHAERVQNSLEDILILFDPASCVVEPTLLGLSVFVAPLWYPVTCGAKLSVSTTFAANLLMFVTCIMVNLESGLLSIQNSCVI